MQDRFKFRAWDKEQNKYLPLVSRGNDLDFWISLDNTGVYLVERDNNRDVAYFNNITEDVIVQFCTGLKDKNGKLIFEGDVLKIVDELVPLHQSVQKIYWSEKKAGFCFRQIMCESSDPFIEEFSLQNMTDKVEVIGNIYETPNY